MRTWPSGISLGCDYNPEQWNPDLWPEDIAAMRRAGVGFVSLGIFSWSWIEPEDGRYEFGWLDTVMDALGDAGIAVALATATASVPMWLATAHPEISPVDRGGRRLWPGSRQTWCPSSETFTRYATRLATEMATRYHDHPALALWHVSNEYGCHNATCYCDTCAAGFRTWLQDRYGDLDELNDAWGTAFWSQRYTAFDQVIPPRLTMSYNNPGQLLDYRRYLSDALLGQYLAECEVLGEHSPGVPITTNFITMSQFHQLDWHDWMRRLRAESGPSPLIVSADHYLVDSLEDPQAEQAFVGDLTRGIAGGPWVLMEHSTSAVNWQPVNVAKGPGQMLRDSLTHVARGADAVGFFQWRASRAGAEKFHSALVPHAGTTSRRFDEVCALGEVVARLSEVAGSQVTADVAILWDYQSYWATLGPAMPSELVDYADLARDIHRALRESHIATDVVSPTADLSSYKVLFVPTLYMVTDEQIAAITAAVESGTHLVVTYFSGIADQSDRIRLGGYPGAFRELLGVRSQEFAPLRSGERVALSGGGYGTIWSEDLDLVGAEAVASYLDGPVAGRPAITRLVEQGSSRWYVATRLDGQRLGALIEQVLADAAVRPVLHGVDPTVDVVRRQSQAGSWVFAVNGAAAPARISVRGYDLITDSPVNGVLELEAGGVAVVREARP